MFGLTRREQRWKAEQKAVETVIPLLTAAIQAGTASRDIDDEKNKAVAAATAPLLARIAEQDALIAKLRLEAQIHAQEACTANATIAEIYQSVTGGTGEPGNWHGAEPVKARIAELTRELEEARKDAIPAMRAYAAKNPRFVSNEDVVQDPLGVHAWLEKHGAAIKEQT